jgi:hypothetical protein
MSHSSLDALSDQISLKLSHRSDDLKHEPARWRAQIKTIA